MSQIKNLSFVLITGVEGSGKTMLVKLLGKLNGYASMAGDYCESEVDGVCQKISAITRKSWNVSNDKKVSCIDRINYINMPKWAKVVVYKRSFPFETEDNMPRIADIITIGRFPRCVVMHRALSECVLTVLQRGYVSSYAEAERRVKMAHENLEEQLQSDMLPPLLRVEYSRLVSESSKLMELSRLETFLNLGSGNLTIHKTFIRHHTSSQAEERSHISNV